MRKIVIVIISLLAAAFGSSAATYSVSSGAEFNELCPNLKPGDEVVWKNGTYSNSRIVFTAAGTAEKPVVLRAETPGKVIMQGLCGFRIRGSHLVVSGFVLKDIRYKDMKDRTPLLYFLPESTDCIASDIYIDGSTIAPDPEPNRKWVQVCGLRNEVSHCSFIEDNSFGVVLECFPGKIPSDVAQGTPICHKILNNKFIRHQTYFGSDGKTALNGQEIIRIGTSTVSGNHADCLVKGNWFYECYGERGEIVSNKCCGNTYSDNLFEGSMGALVLRHGKECNVTGNIFMQSREHPVDNAGGIRIIGSGHLIRDNVMVGLTGRGYNASMCIMRADSDEEKPASYLPVYDVDIEHNFFVACRYCLYLNYGGATCDVEPSDVRFKDNAFICSSDRQYLVYAHNPLEDDGLLWEHNYVSPAGQCYQYRLKEDVKKQPEIPDYESIAAQRRKNAGVRYDVSPE